MARRSNPLESHDQVEPVVRKDLEKKNKSRALGGLVQRSSILACRGYWTLVPKGAILHVPPEFQDRVSEKPAGELLKWRDFHSRNHGWIFTQPVQIANARGEAKLPAHVLKNHRQLGQVVVAVLHHEPISVKALKVPMVTKD